MKSMLFVILMTLSVSAHAYSKGDWQLILTVVSHYNTSVTMGPFGRKDACETAGKKWKADHDAQSNTNNAYYNCARTY